MGAASQVAKWRVLEHIWIVGHWDTLIGNDCSSHGMPVDSDQKAFHHDADAKDSFHLVAGSGHTKYQVIAGDVAFKRMT